MLKPLTQPFKDGVALFYLVKNIANAGNLPKEALEERIPNALPYDELKVGITRFWSASQEHSKIERLLRFPRVDQVKREDVTIPIDGEQYKIVQIQYPPEVNPPCMDLSLERLEVAYEIRTG